MLELLGSLLGFGTSLFPSIMAYFQDSKDKKHELALQEAIAKIQVEQEQVTGEMHNLGIELQNDLVSTQVAHAPMVMTGIGFIDGLRGSVRPVCTYWFMALYSWEKYNNLTWTEFDQVLLATVLSFWFGERLVRKYGK